VEELRNDKGEAAIHSVSGIAGHDLFGNPSRTQKKATETFTSPTLNAKFVLIPAGTFIMGSPKNEAGRDDDETQHQVIISQPFYIQTTEVTQGQWKRVMANNPAGFGSCGDSCPVENVSWNDVHGFIQNLNRLEGTDKYRLPTEAQWEYAARAGTTTAYHWGNAHDCSKANYGNSTFVLTARGSTPARPWAWGVLPPIPGVCTT
jgi:formylglycine-generating enzyme required for sulfatase activity